METKKISSLKASLSLIIEMELTRTEMKVLQAISTYFIETNRTMDVYIGANKYMLKIKCFHYDSTNVSKIFKSLQEKKVIDITNGIIKINDF